MRKKISPEEFVKAWQSSESCYEVANKLDMLYAAVYKRGEYFRLKGIKLKNYPKKIKLDVDALNKLCDNKETQ